MIQSSEPLQSGLIISGQHKQPASCPRSPPGPAGGLGVTAVAERVAVGAAAMAHQHRGRLAEPQLIGDAARAQVGAITEPAVAASAAAAELVHSGRQRQRLRFRGRRWGFRHHRSAFLSNRGPDTAAGAVSAESSPTRRDAGRGQQSAETERVSVCSGPDRLLWDGLGRWVPPSVPSFIPSFTVCDGWAGLEGSRLQWDLLESRTGGFRGDG